MGTQHFIQNSLNAGELTPRLVARDDFQRYTNGVKEMTNFIPLPQGGARTRPGLQYVARTKDNALAYLIGFQFSITQAYVIEVGDLYMRFYKDGGRIYDLNGTITGAANNGAGLIRVTNVAHGLTTNDYVDIVGVLGTVEANSEWKVTVIDADHFDLQGSSFTNAWTSGGTWTRPYQIATTYTIADIPLLRWVQSADTLYIVHGSYAPRKLTRTGHTAWTLSLISFVDGPYMDVNITTTTLTPSAATGAGITVTASAVTGINGNTGFQTTDVGRVIRMLSSTNVWGYVLITARASTTSITADVILTLTNTTARTGWRLGSFSNTSGWPQTINFHEQRLAYGGTTSEPQTVWFSTTGSYDDFTPSATSGTITSDMALTYRLGADTGKVNVIRWLSGGRRFLVGTVGEEFTLDGGAVAFSPATPPVARAYTTYGSYAVQAIRAGSQTFYVQRSGRRLRGLIYDLNTDANKSQELSIFAEHLLRSNNVTRMYFQQEPDYNLWCIRNDGNALTLTYDEDNEIVAWATQPTDGLYKDVTVIPSTDLTADTPWFIISRTVGGVTKYFVEYATYNLDVDCGLTYSGSPTSTVTGLHHLVGKTVQIVGDNAVYDDQVVAADGSVTLKYGSTSGPNASSIKVGIGRPNPTIVTLPPAYKDQGGTIRNKFKHWAYVEVALENSMGLTINANKQLQYRVPSDPMDTGPPSFTGTKRVANLGRSRDGLLTFEQELPLPATILAYYGELDSGE